MTREMTRAEALAILQRMRSNLTGCPAIRAREERRALDVVLAVLEPAKPQSILGAA